MSEPIVAPYGTWRSPISAAMLVEGGVRLGHVTIEDGSVYWLEGRPSEGGRSVVVRRDPGSEPVDVTPDGFNARTTVHEYGGGSYAVHRGVVFSSNFADQRLYRQEPGGAPKPITPDTGGRSRYADGRVTADGSLLICVRERHEDRGRRQRARRSPDGRLGRRVDRRRWLRLLLNAADLSRRDEARVAGVEPPVPAVGRFRAVGGGSRRRRRRLRSSPGRRQARRGVDLPTGVEPGRRPALRLGPYRSGGTSTARSTARCRRSARWMPSSDGRSGCSGLLRTRSSTTGAWHASGTATEHSTSP